MRLAFVADGHSPIARSWMEYFISAGHEVHLLSTYACEPDGRLASVTIVPVAFTGMAAAPGIRPGGELPLRWLLSAGGLRLRVGLRQWLGPLTIPAAAGRVREALQRIKPELVHALRVPFEGMLAAAADPQAPLLCSTWGNDFTFHARSTPTMGLSTRRTMRRLQALHSDCVRDVRLSRRWGFPADRPTIVLPGSGGVRMEVFHPPGEASERAPDEVRAALASLPEEAPVVVNPRGFRAYVRHDTFFRMIPLVLRDHPRARFVCPVMQGEAAAEAWVRRLGLQESVMLLPSLSPAGMAAVFRRSRVTVSLGVHDGTPNTLLESMACGCYPVAGDLESVREWITPETNGLLVDPGDEAAVAAAVSRALADDGLRLAARQTNENLIAQRADYQVCMPHAESFYRSLISAP